MRIECPDCRFSIEIDEHTGAVEVRCPNCSVMVPMPASTGITEAPRRRASHADADESPRRDRPASQPPSRSGNLVLVIGILLLLGAPLLLLMSCAGLSALVTLATQDEREAAMVAAAPPMAVQAQADEAVAQADDPIAIPGLPPAALLPVVGDGGRLKEFIEQNLKLEPQIGALAPDAKIWKKIASAKKDQVVASPLIKGNWGAVDFREKAPDDGILVGFFASAPNDLLVHYLQAIYLTPKGEKVGKAFGVPGKQVFCVKSIEGYAVGAIDVRSGDLFDSFTVRFMRVREDSLEARDSYSSARVGGNGGEPLRVGGDGSIIVGIHGKALNQANITPAGSIATLGVLSIR